MSFLKAEQTLFTWHDFSCYVGPHAFNLATVLLHEEMNGHKHLNDQSI